MAVTRPEEKQISTVREFNRFYTARLGLLRSKYFDGEFSLTEARILYEIGANPWLTAASLRRRLGINAGYLSRTLALLSRRRLVRRKPSKRDGREKLLVLLATGERAVVRLNQQTSLQIQSLLKPVNATDRQALLDAFSRIRSILGEPEEHAVRVVRLSRTNRDAIRLLQEYYEAVHVLQRDTPEAIRKIIEDPASGVWLAYLGEKAVGCVVLRKLDSIPSAGECKRLYVRPEARGHRIADRMMDALEEFGRRNHLRWIYLDSYDDLQAAIALYRKRGYVACRRYNDNPQATLFLRKKII